MSEIRFQSDRNELGQPLLVFDRRVLDAFDQRLRQIHIELSFLNHRPSILEFYIDGEAALPHKPGGDDPSRTQVNRLGHGS